jgi:monoterpene epsilon-lactone hydrolase
MPSIQSQFINLVLRNRHLLKFHLKRESWDWNTSVPAFREECEKGAKRVKLPEGIEVSPVSIEGLPTGLAAEWIRPSGTAPDHIEDDGVIFYTHGGGYVSGSCSDHRGHVAKFVKGSGVPALLYEYRLAPEHPYPAAIEDTLTSYRWLLERGTSPSRIIIVGESAGGGLCLATLLALKDKGIPLPAAGVAISPWTDLKLNGESIRSRTKVSIDPLGMSMVCSKYYAGENDPGDPWISPLYGDLHGLPPLLIYVGNDEMMRDDSTRFAEKAIHAGVDVTLRVGEGMVHCYPLFAPLFPEATQAMDEICSFIKIHIGKPIRNEL